MLHTLKALTAYAASFAKKDWSFSYYPIRVRQQKDVDHQNYRYCAQIINWWTATGPGKTREDAMADLAKNFQAVRKHRTEMPRPGTHAPVEFGSSNEIDSVPADLFEDFLTHILGYDDEDQQLVFVSDESSLWDFSDGLDLSSEFALIKDRYGVDVSDCEGAKLHEILTRIQNKSYQGGAGQPATRSKSK